MPPTWLPTHLLDQAEQRDFLGGVQPYLQGLQEQVSAGVTGLTTAANDVGRQLQVLSEPASRWMASPRPAPMLPPTPAPPAPRPPAPAPSPSPSPIEPFKLPSFEELAGPSMAPAPSSGAATAPSLAPRNSTDPSPFRLPTFEDLTGFPETVRRAVGGPTPTPAPTATALPNGAGALPSSLPSTPPTPGGDLRAYARSVATARGLDPDIFERQIQQESGFNPKAVSPAGAQGIAQFMPATARGVGLADPFEPYAALDASARHMADNLKANGGDYARALAAYNAGQGNVDKHGGVPPFAETQQYVRAILGDRRPTAPPAALPVAPQAPVAASVGAAARPSPATTGPAGVPTAVAEGAGWRETWGKDLTPHQINETLNLGLSWDAALATCGVAAAVAFGRANGRSPTFKEALDLARATGEWNADVGMTRGTTGQLALLKGLGVEARAAPLAEPEVAAAVQRGQPVQINAHGNGGHFYVAQGYDPQTRKFDFGNSAAILKRSGGNTWYRLDELPSLGVGTPSEAIYLAGGR